MSNQTDKEAKERSRYILPISGKEEENFTTNHKEIKVLRKCYIMPLYLAT